MTEKQRNLNIIFKIAIGIALLASICTVVLHLFQDGIYFSDHKWYWQECACTLKGVDASVAIMQNLYFEDIGELPANSATLPWMKFIGIFVHGSFLPYEASCVYYMILNIVVFTVATVLIYKRLYSETKSRECALLGSASIFTSWYLTDWIQQGNNATLVCLLTIIIICIIDKYEILSGLLLGIAMIKPQIILPFYVVFLLRKKWKAIIVSAVMVIVSWGLSAGMTQMNPLTQLYNVLFMSFSYDQSFWIYGIFDSLQNVGLSSSFVMLLSMIAGVAVCAGFSWNSLKSEICDNRLFFQYMTPAIVSVFWCYKSQCDYNILMIVAVGIVEFWYMSGEHNIKNLIGLIVLLAFVLMKPFSMINAIIGTVGIWNRAENIHMVLHIDLYVKSLLVLLFVFGRKTNDA